MDYLKQLVEPRRRGGVIYGTRDNLFANSPTKSSMRFGAWPAWMVLHQADAMQRREQHLDGQAEGLCQAPEAAGEGGEGVHHAAAGLGEGRRLGRTGF